VVPGRHAAAAVVPGRHAGHGCGAAETEEVGGGPGSLASGARLSAPFFLLCF